MKKLIGGLIPLVVALGFIVWSMSLSKEREQRLLEECIELNENTLFECKEMAHSMVWDSY